MALLYRDADTKYAGVIVNGYYNLKEIMDIRVFIDVERKKFENRLYLCTKHYDIYLTKLYGNYMELPPEEKRISNHNYSAYIKKI